MSMRSFENLACPECGHRQSVPVWQSLNVSIDPDERQNLFDGKINFLDCSKCGKKTFINTPFVYHDMHLGFWIKYIPFKMLEDDETFVGFQFKPDGFPSVEDNEDMGIPADSYARTQHVVFDMGELVRYVIFRERLFSVLNKGKWQSSSYEAEN